MTADKALLGLVPTLQAVALLKGNIKALKKKKKNLVKLGVENIVGTSLIKTQADFINSY